ncbi:MAG: methyltransferase domain-containing protein [Gemmatimonadota bacterium]
MRRRSLFVVVALLLSAALACQRGEPGESPPEAADTTGLAEAGSSAGSAGNDHQEEIPTRSAEVARDAGSKPQQLMDVAGIRPGDRVADIFAGSGYFTYLLSERVGPEGRVYAQGYSPGLAARVEQGDLADAGNVVLVDSLSQLPTGELDAALIIRGYHLFENPSDLMAALRRSLAPDGRVAVVELRLGRERGHDMETHRMGEQTVIDDFHEGGFELAESNDLLRNPEDDHTDFWEGRRHLADRMLLVFSPSAEESAGATASGGSTGP